MRGASRRRTNVARSFIDIISSRELCVFGDSCSRVSLDPRPRASFIHTSPPLLAQSLSASGWSGLSTIRHSSFGSHTVAITPPFPGLSCGVIPIKPSTTLPHSPSSRSSASANDLAFFPMS